MEKIQNIVQYAELIVAFPAYLKAAFLLCLCSQNLLKLKKKKACAGKGWKQVSSSDNLNG